MGAGWIILIILILMLALIFGFKIWQTRQEAETSTGAWPDSDKGGEKPPQTERPAYETGGPAEGNSISIPPRPSSNESKKQD
jgi:hypothetical protein